MNLEEVKLHVRNVPDFPIKGVQFKDLTTVFKDPIYLKVLTTELVQKFGNLGVTKVVGIESRGFIMGPIMAVEIGAGFVPLRKPGKLPAETISESYEKEYGVDTIEIHKDAISSEDVVVIHDDLLATGGTMLAAYRLVKQFNPKRIYISTIVELEFLQARELFDAEVEVHTLIKY